MRILLILCISLITILSCKDQSSIPNNNGFWESIGHGRILEIKDSSEYVFYDITSISCLPVRKSEFDDISNHITLKNDTLCLLEGTIEYKFIKLNSAPSLCQKQSNLSQLNDPMYNFEVFMETVKEHYAFLELNEIKWNDLYEKQKAKITKEFNSADLYLLIEETQQMLNDNHAFLEATDDVYDELDKREKIKDQESNDSNPELIEYGDFPVADLVAKHNLKEVMTKDSWLINWGKMTDKLGYIQLKSMWLYADLNTPKSLIDSLGFVDAYAKTRSEMFEGDYAKKEAEGAGKLMNRVMQDLKDSESIVIDVRFNGGGQDIVSYTFLSYFVENRILAAKQKFRYGTQNTPVHNIYIDGKPTPYTKPVYLLTSPQSGSAAESFTMCSLNLPHVKRIGSATEGALSSTLDKKLPIGWDFCLSNELYSDLNQNIYENIGIPVDYDLNYSRDRQTFFRYVVNNLEEDKQNILKAIDHISKK